MYRFVNFKSFADATLELRTPVTILIGRNGAGKSNVIEGIELLAGMVSGAQLGEVGLPTAHDARIPIRGGLAECVQRNQTEFIIELHEPDPKGGKPNRLLYKFGLRREVDVGRRSRLAIVEALTFEDEVLFESEPSGAHNWIYYGANVLLRKQSYQPSDNKATIGPSIHVPSDANESGIRAAQKLIIAAAGVVKILAPNTALMRSFVPDNDGDLHRDGSNLAAALLWLHEGTAEQKKRFQRVAAAIRPLLEQKMLRIEMLPMEPMSQVSFQIEFDTGKIPATLLSDGTLFVAAVATALETAKAGSIVVIEDIDHGVHPGQMSHVLKFVEDTAKRNKLRVILSTHNPATLDALTPEQMAGVVLCWWDETAKASQLRHLSDLPDNYPIIGQGHLGEVATREMYRSRLDPNYEQKSQQAFDQRMAELEKLRQQTSEGK